MTNSIIQALQPCGCFRPKNCSLILNINNINYLEAILEFSKLFILIYTVKDYFTAVAMFAVTENIFINDSFCTCKCQTNESRYTKPSVGSLSSVLEGRIANESESFHWGLLIDWFINTLVH